MRHGDEMALGGCFKGTRTTASKSYLHASDFPMPESYGHFPNHVEVLNFLKARTPPLPSVPIPALRPGCAQPPLASILLC